MSRRYERDEDLFASMLDHCERVLSAVQQVHSFEQYSHNWIFQDAIKMNLFQVGELANRISDKRKGEISDIPWKNIIGMRNIIAHGYISIDENTLWETCVKDIPQLIERLKTIVG